MTTTSASSSLPPPLTSQRQLTANELQEVCHPITPSLHFSAARELSGSQNFNSWTMPYLPCLSCLEPHDNILITLYPRTCALVPYPTLLCVCVYVCNVCVYIYICTCMCVLFLPYKCAATSQTADLASANASEEDKVKAMMNQSSKDYDPSRYLQSM